MTHCPPASSTLTAHFTVVPTAGPGPAPSENIHKDSLDKGRALLIPPAAADQIPAAASAAPSILEQRLAHWLQVTRIMAEVTPSTCVLPSSISHVLDSFLTPNAKGLV